jgi:photosystem II stability/assembly factor-like uncharacterized protein
MINTNQKTLLLLFSLFLLQTIPAVARGNDPQASVGIAGGPMFSIALIPLRSSAVLIGTGTGIYKNLNGETIWKPSNEGLASTYVYDIVPDSVTATILYAATKAGVSKSTDDGAQWTSLGLADYQVFTLAVNPVTTTYLAAGTPQGVFTSTDGGTTWTDDAAGPLNTYALAIDPQSPRVVYAGSFGDGVFKSSDFGTEWSACGSGPQKVHTLLAHPTTSGTVYAGTDEGLYKSTNSGSTWSHLANDFSGVPVYDLAINASSPAILYAATDNGIYKTTNSGTSWSAINSGINQNGSTGPFARAIAINQVTPTNLYAGVYSGVGNDIEVYKSTNSGSTWVQVNRTLANTSVLSLAFDPQEPSIVYAGTSTMAVLKSTDRGVSWREANEGFTNFLVTTVAVNPDDSTVYAGTASGLFLSTDSGETWEAASPNPEIYSIAVDPFDTAKVYTGTNHGIFVTSDAGETWVGKNDNLTNPYVTALAFHPATQYEVYAGTQGDGVFKSTNGGDTWVTANNGMSRFEILSLAFAPTSPATLFAGTRLGGLFKSTYNGTSWTKASSDLASYTITSIAITSDSPWIMYAGTEDHGLYRSTDGGVRWTVVDDLIKNRTVTTLCLDPQDAQRLLVGLEGDIREYVFNQSPYKPSNPVPADGATDQPTTLTLTWSGGDPDTGDSVTYKVFFGTTSSFGDNATATVTTPSYTLIGLALNTTYYWKVVAVDSKDAATESDVWSFTTIISNPPETPSNPSPADGATDQPLFLTLRWSGSDPDDNDTVTYDVYFGMQKQPPLVSINSAKAEFTPLQPLLPFTTYYWKVVARDNNGRTTAGSVWKFTTKV